MQECTDFPSKSPGFLFLLSWVSWQLFFMVETLHKYNKNMKSLLRFPLLHRSCLNVDIDTKSTNLKLNRKLDPATLTAPCSFRCPASDITHYYLESCLTSICPAWCFFIRSCPQHTGSRDSSLSFKDPVSLFLPNHPTYPYCISWPCFAVLSHCMAALKWQPTLVFLPGKSHGQRSLAGYSLQGCRKSDMTEQLSNNYTVLWLVW